MTMTITTTMTLTGPTENRALIECLRGQRNHVLGAVDGLDDATMRRPVLPSGWSCIELIHHLALDDERFWFQAVIAASPAAIDGLTDDAWTVPDGMRSAEVLDLYATESAVSDDLLATVDLDAEPGWWPDFFPPSFRKETVRDVVLHVIAETATHAGHLDAVRELIDGRQWLALT